MALTPGTSSIALLGGCANHLSDHPIAPRKAQGATLQNCARLAADFHMPNTVIDTAVPIEAGEIKLAVQAVAAHCLVKGHMHKRLSSDGQGDMESACSFHRQ